MEQFCSAQAPLQFVGDTMWEARVWIYARPDHKNTIYTPRLYLFPSVSLFLCHCLLCLCLTHTHTHTHTQCGPQMAWWCQGERGLLGSKSSSVWPLHPSLAFFFSFCLSFYSSPSSAFNLASSPPPSRPPFLSFSLSRFVSLHFFP